MPVDVLFDWLKNNYTLDHFLSQFPSVSREQAQQVLDLSKEQFAKFRRAAG